MAEIQRKIVLGIDGSEHSERALQFYLDNLHRGETEVHLVHAMEYPYIPSQPYVRKDVVAEIFNKVRKEGEQIEEKFKKVLAEKQIPCKSHTDFAHPGEYICKVAQDEGAALLIMGTRGMGTIRRTIMGSVSDYVVHHAHCPVLIARH